MVGLSGKVSREQEYEAFVAHLSQQQLSGLADLYSVDLAMFGYSATVEDRAAAGDDDDEDGGGTARGVMSPSRGARSNRIWRVPEL